MAFPYNQELINNAFTYSAYRQHLNDEITQPPKDESAEKMRPFTQKNVTLMDQFDTIYQVSDKLKATLQGAPPAIWLVLTEGWCGDAAFNVPMLATLEKAMPEKVKLRLLLRDSNLELMDAHLTDGGRSIPKLIVLSKDWQVLASWGPRPAGLQTLMKRWKEDGLTLKEIIPQAHAWYDADATQSVQEELITLVQSYT